MRYATHGCRHALLWFFPLIFPCRKCSLFVLCLLRTCLHISHRRRRHRLCPLYFRQYFRKKYLFHRVLIYLFSHIFCITFGTTHNDVRRSRKRRRKKKMKDDEEGKTRKRINSDAKGSLDGTIFTYIYASDDAIEDDDDGDDNDDNVSRVPLKNINAIISMMMINAFVAPHRALPLAVSAFFFSLTRAKVCTFAHQRRKCQVNGKGRGIKCENLLAWNESHD